MRTLFIPACGDERDQRLRQHHVEGGRAEAQPVLDEARRRQPDPVRARRRLVLQGSEGSQVSLTQEELEQQLRAACEIVETYARAVGPNCEIIFCEKDVQIAPLHWSGCVNAETLYDALVEAYWEARDE
jgi:hypothetical protein